MNTPANTHEFKVGDSVRISDDKIDGFMTAVQPKIKNRVGKISRIYDKRSCYVRFHAVGRRKEYAGQFNQTLDLTLVKEGEES